LRQIGTLPKDHDPTLFRDYLLSLEVKARIDDRPQGWLVWIYDENQVPRAREELERYLANPQDPRYPNARSAAQKVREREQALDREFQKNLRDVHQIWSAPNLRQYPLTIALLLISIVVFIVQHSSEQGFVWTTMNLSFASVMVGEDGLVHDDGLAAIRAGEVWRLITPIFMHGDILHIFFNMSGLSFLGTLIEIRRGTARLAALVLVSAVLCHLGQYLYMERTLPGTPHLFEGMSGVLYALFGYVWMKSLYHPDQGMHLHPNAVIFMLLWLALCMTGVLGPIANAEHVIGLVVGVGWGMSRF